MDDHKVNIHQFSHSVVSDSLQPHGLQHTRPPCPSPTPRVYSNSWPLIELLMPSNHLILCHPLLLPPSIFPSIRVISNESIRIRWPKYWNFSFNIVLPMNIQDWFPFNFSSVAQSCPTLCDHMNRSRIRLIGSPCTPRNSQESSPTPQFKSIHSLLISFLYSPILTSIHDYWENHSLN